MKRILHIELESCEGCPNFRPAMFEAYCLENSKNSVAYSFSLERSNYAHTDLFKYCPLPEVQSLNQCENENINYSKEGEDKP